ncbi:MAG TPA: hypothetical protein PKB03_04720 [Baekduia sp.]|nr:hypothetical protein [Baekduia sp.]
MRISATALLATLLILAVPGCGSDPAADRAQAYVEGVDAARAALVSDLEQLAAEAPPTSTPKTEAQLLLRYEKAVGRAQTRVRALKPPEKVKAEHTQLLSALRSYEVALGKPRASGAKAPAPSIPPHRGNRSAAEQRIGTIAAMPPTLFWTQVAITVCVLISIVIGTIKLV